MANADRKIFDSMEVISETPRELVKNFAIKTNGTNGKNGMKAYGEGIQMGEKPYVPKLDEINAKKEMKKDMIKFAFGAGAGIAATVIACKIVKKMRQKI